MSDEYEDISERALELSELFDQPDINQYFDEYDPEFELAWNAAPLGGFTEGQIEAFVDILLDLDVDEWEQLIDDIENDDWDFWDWWGDHVSPAT